MSTTSKHPRDADASDAEASVKMLKGDDSQPPSSSLATFWDLPFELRSTIFALAYKEQDKDDDASKCGDRQPRLDRKTLLSLTLVSCDLHSTFSPILYQDVKITHPSMLAEFQHSLTLRPSNALLVKNLHLGPLAELAKGWWPTRWIRDPLNTDGYGYTDEPIVLMNTSLTSCDEALRPRWCKPDQEWVHECPWDPAPSPRTCQDVAVTDVIKAALKGVGVSLYTPYGESYKTADARGEFLSINKWTTRVFEAQAIVDLYLAKMRRVEEKKKRLVPSWQDSPALDAPRGPDKCIFGRCAHYPRLDLEGFHGRQRRETEGAWRKRRADESSESEEESHSRKHQAQRAKRRQYRFTITLDQVNKHLGRRGTQVDHFDHPLLFARGGQQMLALTRDGKAGIVHGDYPYTARERFYDWDDDVVVDEFDRNRKGLHVWFSYDRDSDSDFMSSRSPSPTSNASRRPTLDPPPSKNVIELGRSVLQLTHRVKNLSLTSYLARCIEPEGPSLSAVRCLSLGPLKPPEYLSSCLASLKTPLLASLRVCGGDLSTAAAEALGNPSGELTELRKVVWDYGALNLPSKDTYERSEFLVGVLRLLQGGPAVKAAEELNGSDRVVSTAVERAAIGKDAPSVQPSESSGKARLMEARLHPDLLALVLEHAPSPEARAAWLDGSLLPGAPNRVRITQSRAAMVRHNQDSESRLQDTKLLLKDSEEWWEDAAVDCSQTAGATVGEEASKQDSG